MEDPTTPSTAAAHKRLNELALLYQFSSTLLSTIRLNKLTHLTLTALASGATPLFERATLFLLNEKSGVLQGMLGVTRESAADLELVGDSDNPLGKHWDISDGVIARQRGSEFCGRVRSTRIEIDADCPVVRPVVNESRPALFSASDCHQCTTCDSLRNLGVTAFAAVPLLSRDKNLGMIVVDNPLSGAAITDEDLHFLQLFANQAAMAIENSMLYNRIEEALSNLRDARERLIHGERLAAIGEMAANLAHELKNPLITIGGFAGRLLKALPGECREYRYADTIVREVNRLEKMLAEILAFSRKPTICYSPCELGEILKDCFDNCATATEDQGIDVTSSFAGRVWPVLGDPHQLKQVFLNLLLNACEVMPRGGTIRVVVEHVPDDPSRAMISISDTGGGIPAEMLPNIFNPFFTTKNHGTGLGLAIVSRILVNHKGTIEAFNDEQGAVFRVTLPLVARVEKRPE